MFFERHKGGEQAVLVHLDCMDDKEREDLREFQELVNSAGAVCVALVEISRQHSPNPRYLLGQGKVDEIEQLVRAHKADIVLINHALTPSQERNLERVLQCRVVDRTGLILDIFAQRARTHEGKLQVELAQLQHLSTRLVRGWTHLERQKGGIGLRGPGESQLETDRRLVRERIRTIKQRLDKVRRQREQGRRARRRAEVPLVSLVGYTNAGKSTLFNSVTESRVYAADKLFATLDPTLRRLELKDVGPIVLADTVGFIRHLPHKLVEAFRATLEESAQADLLLHIIDSADSDRDDNIEQVESVLGEIGAMELPKLEVFNKIDLLDQVEPRIERDQSGHPVRVWLSAKTGAGADLLFQAIAELVAEDMIEQQITIDVASSRLRARLYSAGAVQEEHYDEQGRACLSIRMPRKEFIRMLKREGMNPADYQVEL